VFFSEHSVVTLGVSYRFRDIDV